MTDVERRACLALVRCRLLPGSWPKRFARDMAENAADPDFQASARQRVWLWKLVVKHRRQLPPDLVAYAEACQDSPGGADHYVGGASFPAFDNTLAHLLGSLRRGDDESLLLMADRCGELSQGEWADRCHGWHSTLAGITGRDARERRKRVVEAVRQEFRACWVVAHVVQGWKRRGAWERGRFVRAVERIGLAWAVEGDTLAVYGPCERGQRSRLRVAAEWLEGTP